MCIYRRCLISVHFNSAVREQPERWSGRYGFQAKKMAGFIIWISGILPAGKKGDQVLLADNGDMDQVMTTVMQIIEIYTERYPRRTIRLKGNTSQKAQLYRAALDKHLPILCPLFLIELEEKLPLPDSDRSLDAIAFLLKRKPIPYLTFHIFQTIWTGQSRLFGKKVKIELEKGIRIGVALPAV